MLSMLATPWLGEVSGALTGPSTAVIESVGNFLPDLFAVDIDVILLVVSRVYHPAAPRDFAFGGICGDLEFLPNVSDVVAPRTMNVTS